MKDGSEFGAASRYLVLGSVIDVHRPNFNDTVNAFYSQLQKSAQELGGQVHEECSSVVFGPWDLAIYVTAPNQQALIALMSQANSEGKIRTETYLAPNIKAFSQASKSAWTRTGQAQSPVEGARR